LFAALLLRHRGWNVDIYERVESELAGRGAGIVTHRPLWDALDEIGIEWRDNLGVEVSTRRMLGLDGTLLLEFECPQTMTAWDRMYDLLRSVFPSKHYQRGKELIRIEQSADAVTAIFADGTRASGDVLIGCDGVYVDIPATMPQQQCGKQSGQRPADDKSPSRAFGSHRNLHFKSINAD
jgi:2-polyprenyl-6-methoxyphenol hydroxylase-like FAD-dependent oxidoreductase